LFGVNTRVNGKTQERLIREITNFRNTMRNLLEKVTILESRNETILKDNLKINKQLNILEAKQQQMLKL
jgi:hypothetical protein